MFSQLYILGRLINFRYTYKPSDLYIFLVILVIQSVYSFYTLDPWKTNAPVARCSAAVAAENKIRTWPKPILPLDCYKSKQVGKLIMGSLPFHIQECQEIREEG